MADTAGPGDLSRRAAGRPAAPLRGAVLLLLAGLVLHLVLIQPNHPRAMTPQALLLFPLELPAILLAMLALPGAGWPSRLLRALLLGALVVLVLLKLADFGTFSAFNRAFNPVLDLHLLDAGWRLASGAVGGPTAAAALVAGAAGLAVTGLLVWWALRVWARVALPRPARIAAGLGAVLATGIAIAEIGATMRVWTLPADPPGAAFTARVAVERTRMYRAALADLADFRTASQNDPFAGAPGLFDRLAGRDVMLVFVESYGRTSFDNPLYAPTHVPTLRGAEALMRDAGLGMASGWLTSPIAGGQSWLAHGTTVSGLTTASQTRYAAMLGSPRRTLFHLARDAGYHAAAVMPAITMAWPEAELLGFQTVLASDDLGYAGQPFNWVTMPDQYTLAVFADRLPDDAPLFVQIALISSHAPWVPVPGMIDWDAVGDGTVFDRWATSGDPPEVVWRDRDRVRDQYRQSVDYALQAVMDWAARQGPDGPLMVILGDHQPAGFVSQIDSMDVPVHLIGPPDLVALAAGWGWSDGLVPQDGAPVWPMAAFRDNFIRAFTSAPPGATTARAGGDGT